jgi:hypothetical protein
MDVEGSGFERRLTTIPPPLGERAGVRENCRDEPIFASV